MSRARKEINASPKIANGTEPPFQYGIICCALRMFEKDFSGYYGQMFELHPQMPRPEMYGLAAVDLARAMIDIRNTHGVPIAGFDIAGAESGYPAEDYKRAYDLAHLFGVAVAQFWTSLVLLGIGWNFLYIGGTTLLTETYRPEERAKAQGANDFAIFVMMAISSLSSGMIVTHGGWEWLNVAALLPLVALIAAIAWFVLHQRSRRAPAGA